MKTLEELAFELDRVGAAQKCELCLENSCGEPACVKGCPNRAIVYEEREEAV